MAERTTAEIVDDMGKLIGLLYYHMAKAVIKKYGPDSKDAILEGVRAYGHERGKKIRDKVSAQGLELNLKNLDDNYDLPLKLGWKAKRDINEPDHVHKKVSYCPFAEVWKDKEDGGELGSIYCEQDKALLEAYNPEIDFNRISIIPLGADCCETVVRRK